MVNSKGSTKFVITKHAIPYKMLISQSFMESNTRRVNILTINEGEGIYPLGNDSDYLRFLYLENGHGAIWFWKFVGQHVFGGFLH